MRLTEGSHPNAKQPVLRERAPPSGQTCMGGTPDVVTDGGAAGGRDHKHAGDASAQLQGEEIDAEQRVQQAEV